jgi:hypothetical protein
MILSSGSGLAEVLQLFSDISAVVDGGLEVVKMWWLSGDLVLPNGGSIVVRG